MALAAWGLLFVQAHDWLRAHAHRGIWGQLTTGRSLIALTLLVGSAVLITGLVAVRRGERSVVVLAPLALAGLVTLFWLLFGIGEVVAPH